MARREIISAQADRIEALLTEVNAKLDLWLAAQKRVQRKISEEVRDKIHTDYAARFQGDLTAMDFQIDLALQHEAAKKNSNMNLYVRNWLNADINKKAVKPPEDRDKYENQDLPPRRRTNG